MNRVEFDAALNYETIAALQHWRTFPSGCHDLALAYARPDIATVLAGVLEAMDLALVQMKQIERPGEAS